MLLLFCLKVFQTSRQFLFVSFESHESYYAWLEVTHGLRLTPSAKLENLRKTWFAASFQGKTMSQISVEFCTGFWTNLVTVRLICQICVTATRVVHKISFSFSPVVVKSLHQDIYGIVFFWLLPLLFTWQQSTDLCSNCLLHLQLNSPCGQLKHLISFRFMNTGRALLWFSFRFPWRCLPSFSWWLTQTFNWISRHITDNMMPSPSIISTYFCLPLLGFVCLITYLKAVVRNSCSWGDPAVISWFLWSQRKSFRLCRVTLSLLHL